MARHLEACHADEHEIASLPEISKSSSDIRNKTFEIEQFRKFPSKYQCFNKKSGTLIIGKRASGKEAKTTYHANFGRFFPILRPYEAHQNL